MIMFKQKTQTNVFYETGESIVYVKILRPMTNWCSVIVLILFLLFRSIKVLTLEF